jgi:pimeloyl-ACP methyl ester carboxylesterase
MKSVRYRSDDIDPRASLSQLRIPAFWVFGGQDNLVPVDLSVGRLQELIERGQSQFQFKMSSDYRHEVIVFDPSRLSLSRPFNEGVDWIKSAAGRASQQGVGLDGL